METLIIMLKRKFLHSRYNLEYKIKEKLSSFYRMGQTFIRNFPSKNSKEVQSTIWVSQRLYGETQTIVVPIKM